MVHSRKETSSTLSYLAILFPDFELVLLARPNVPASKKKTCATFQSKRNQEGCVETLSETQLKMFLHLIWQRNTIHHFWADFSSSWIPPLRQILGIHQPKLFIDLSETIFSTITSLGDIFISECLPCFNENDAVDGGRAFCLNT